MAHITFIHGIGNKPAADDLLRLWNRLLASGDGGIDLGAEGITAEMVYWADVMYAEPSVDGGSHESADTTMDLDEPELDVDSMSEAAASDEEVWMSSLRGKLNFDAEGDDEFTPPMEDIGAEFERIPIPWAIKRRLMKVFLRDVHHYLFNTESVPREKSFATQDEIRLRFVDAVKRGADREGPHIVIAHSMGTVISYDCLKRVDDCPAVDGYMTIGSPLGLDEIQDKLQPGWSRDDGFPSERVRGDWVNVYDRLDAVAGLDPAIANDFRRGGESTVMDVHQSNPGAWRHDAGKYMAGALFREQLSRMLGFSDV